MRTTDRRPAGTGLLAALLVGAVLALPSAAGAATEVQQGARLLNRVQAGTVSCSSLKTADFERIGEYVMERMLGSATAHDAMDRQMAAAMDEAGETQAHVYMGRRFAGCATGQAPATFGAMMGMMGAGMMGAASGGTSPGGMMGGGAAGYGYANMMGSRADGDDWTSGDTAMAVFMGLFVLIALAALLLWRPWQRPAAMTPEETLRRRLAAGDIDQAEFDRRRAALGGTP